MEPHLLVVDDDVKTLDILAEVLRDEGYSVTTARDGGEALELLGRETFSLVVTDLNMPKATGADLLAFVRSRELPLPVIIVTADGDRAARDQATALGAADYVSKPIDLDDLAARVRQRLARSA